MRLGTPHAGAKQFVLWVQDSAQHDPLFVRSWDGTIRSSSALGMDKSALGPHKSALCPLFGCRPACGYIADRDGGVWCVPVGDRGF